MKKLFLLLMAVMLTTTFAFAQNVNISGTVVDAENDEPLIGASVQPVGSSAGVATDIDGHFTLSVPASVKEITVSYVGYTSVTLPVKPVMDIKLKVASTSLDVLVVTGYGSAKKLGSVVGSVAVVDNAVLESTPTANFVDALSGQVAGMSISSNTGEPSSTSTDIRIRGVNSLNASTDPLFILDGAPVSSSVFTAISSSDIENITVLKDASATAIYGSRAANGVIVITTKKGKYGEQAKVTVRANVGWSERVQSKIQMMNSQQYLTFRETMSEALGVQDLSQSVKDLINNYGISTDWQKEMMKDNALYYSVEGAVQGGSESSSYYISLGHMDQDGIIAKSGFRRETLRGSIDARIKPWLKVGLQTNLSYAKYETNSVASYAGSFYMNGPIVLSYMMLPYESPYYYTFDENGKIVYGDRANWYKYTNGGIADANFVNDLNKGSRSSLNIDAMLYEQLNPIAGLTIRAQQAVTSFDYRNSQIQTAVEDYVTPMGDLTDFGQYTEPLRSEAFQRMYQFTYTNTAEYARTFGVHDFSALLGQESVIYHSNNFNVATTGQPNNMQMLLTNGKDVTMDNVGQGISEYIINSYFLNLHYSYDNRYFFDGSIRRDGSSKFAPGHRWSTFYAIGAMWNVKNEAFLNPYTWLDDLKLRVNYGTVGNSGISPYMYMGTVSTGNAYNNENTLGLANQSNENLTWETVKQFDLGLSYSVLNSRLYGTVDFYVKNTEDMLMELPYSYTTGWSGGMANIGSMRNIGVDFEIGSKIYQSRDWYVGVRANFNYNKNTITELFNGRKEYRMDDTGMVYRVGENPFQLNTVRYAGVDPQDGKQLWYDIDGNLTKQFNHERDAVNTGKSFVAPWNGGFGIDLRWKDLSLRSDWTWTAEKYIFNWASQMICNPAYMYDTNMDVRMLDSWTHPGQITDMPAVTESIQPDSRYLENSSYLRMKNITLTYSLPKTFVNKLYMSNVAFHFTGRN
ncbi:MAG: SusC/RagA family TonB-linked outer membrane protein, partial [Muribaculaceae bacterium]|nr:SusC/RagA family TonB-linked outer membrane protein [Muribaculaceae bacterium]